MRGVANPKEARGKRLEDGYLLAVLLIVVTIITYSVVADHRFGQLAVVAVQGVTLLVILRASSVSRRTFQVIAVFVGLALTSSAISISIDRQTIGPGLVGALLAIIGPVVIVRRILNHARIDLATVSASICVYLLAGMFFAYVFKIIDIVDGPFFAQKVVEGPVDFVYFSFVTLATLGYGDLTARASLGRMLSISEALLGQLYLVSVVALLVANLGRSRGAARNPEADESEDR